MAASKSATLAEYMTIGDECTFEGEPATIERINIGTATTPRHRWRIRRASDYDGQPVGYPTIMVMDARAVERTEQDGRLQR